MTAKILIWTVLLVALGQFAEYLGHDRLHPQHRTIVHHQTSSKPGKHAGERVWYELDQASIDTLTATLKTMTPKPVTILCRDRSECGDLSLDLENAFESAKWPVKIDAPVLGGDQEGIDCNDAEIAKAVATATGLSIQRQVGLSAAPVRDIYISVGRRPR